MNLTTPHAVDSIAVLRTRQLEATKRRVLAELRDVKLARATVQYRADPTDSGEIRVVASNGEHANGTATVLEHPIDAAFYDICTLVERFALDLVAHHHGGFEDTGGYGHVILHADKGAVRIEHTSIETTEVSSETDL